MLSLKLPSRSKLRFLTHVQRGGCALPMLVLATHSALASGVTKLSINTSSCLIGPFTLRRLRTHVHTLLQHRGGRNRDRLVINGLALGVNHHRM